MTYNTEEAINWIMNDERYYLEAMRLLRKGKSLHWTVERFIAKFGSLCKDGQTRFYKTSVLEAMKVLKETLEQS